QSRVNGAGWGLGGSGSTSFFPQCMAFNAPCVSFSLGDTTSDKTSLLFPSITGSFPAQTRANFLGGTYAFIKPNRDPMVQSYTFEIQQEFPGKLAVSLAYVGTHGSHLAGSGPGNWLNYVSTKNALKHQPQLSNNYPNPQFYSVHTGSPL